MFSSLGKKRFAVNAALLFIDFVVLVLSAKVNQFQEFFFVADIFPFALSIITLVVLLSLNALDVGSPNAFTARAPFQIGLFSTFTIIWLAFNSFSTFRWRHIPLSCDAIPKDFSDERSWCRNIQALKASIWVEWVIFLLTTAFTLRFVLSQSRLGNKHVWTDSLSRYTPGQRLSGSDTAFHHHRNSSFLQWEMFSRSRTPDPFAAPPHEDFI